MTNWGDNEIHKLLSLLAEDVIYRHVRAVKDGPRLEGLARKMSERGFTCNKAQVINKLKTLRKRFHAVNDHNGSSGRGRLVWPCFDMCQAGHMGR